MSGKIKKKQPIGFPIIMLMLDPRFSDFECQERNLNLHIFVRHFRTSQTRLQCSIKGRP